MQEEYTALSIEARCRQTAGRIVHSLNQLREPFRRNTIHWLESCVDKPIEDVNDDLTSYFRQLNPEMRESTMSSLELVLQEAVRKFG